MYVRMYILPSGPGKPQHTSPSRQHPIPSDHLFPEAMGLEKRKHPTTRPANHTTSRTWRSWRDKPGNYFTFRALWGRESFPP